MLELFSLTSPNSIIWRFHPLLQVFFGASVFIFVVYVVLGLLKLIKQIIPFW